MDVLQSKTKLGEPVKNLVFREIYTFSSLLRDLSLVRNLGEKIAIFTILHNYAKLTMSIFVNIFERSNIWVMQSLQNLSLFESLSSIILVKLVNLDFFDNSILASLLTLCQPCSTKRTTAKLLDSHKLLWLLVSSCLHLL